MKHINEFFENNPTASEVHEALGRLFTDKEKANQYLGGVSSHVVKSYTRKGLQFEKASDKLYAAILEKQNDVNQKQLEYEQAGAMEKQNAFNAWTKSQEELRKLEYDYNKALNIEAKDAKIEKEKASKKQESPNKEVKEETEEEKLQKLKVAIEKQKSVVAVKATALENAKKPESKQKAEAAYSDAVKKLQELEAQLPQTLIEDEANKVEDNRNNNNPE